MYIHTHDRRFRIRASSRLLRPLPRLRPRGSPSRAGGSQKPQAGQLCRRMIQSSSACSGARRPCSSRSLTSEASSTRPRSPLLQQRTVAELSKEASVH